MQAPTEATRRQVEIGINVLALGAAIALLYFGRVFFITLTISISIAFLLEPGVAFFMRLRLPRGGASFVVCSMALVFLYLACFAAYSEALSMSEDLPAYSARVTEVVDGATARIDQFETSMSRLFLPKKAEAPPPDNKKKGKRAPTAEPPPVQEVRVQSEPPSFVKLAYDSVRSFYNVLLMASFVPFLVYFILAWWDQLKLRLDGMFGDSGNEWSRAMAGVADMVRAYVIGNFVLGLFLSVASALLFVSVKVPYWLLAGTLSGFLSLAPYVGLPLAILPPVLAAVPTTNSAETYAFIVGVVAVLHLIGLNLLYPRFVGARVHLNPIAVTISLMFWGTIWGGIGLLLAIPMTAGMKAVCDNVESLNTYGRLLGD